MNDAQRRQAAALRMHEMRERRRAGYVGMIRNSRCVLGATVAGLS